MDRKKYKSELIGAIYDRNGWKLSAILLLFVVLGLTGKILFTTNTTTTVLQPVGSAVMWNIDEESADNEYISTLAYDFAALYLNVTPKTVRGQHQRILKHIHPQHYGAMEARLNLEAKKIETDNVSTVFYPSDVYIDRKNRVVYLTGPYLHIVGKEASEQVVRYFKMPFYLLAGTFFIGDFKEIQRNEVPRN